MKKDSKASRLKSRKVIKFSSAKSKLSKNAKARLLKKTKMNDAQRMSEIRRLILDISDQDVRDKLWDSWSEQALIVGLSGFVEF